MKVRIKEFALIAATALVMMSCGSSSKGSKGLPSEPDPEQGIIVAADRVTTSANDLRGLTYARVAPHAGKIYASGHVGTTNETRKVVVARFNADGSPDTTFGSGGFVELEATATQANGDENSLGIAELQSGGVVVTAQATDADGGQSVYLFRLDKDGEQVDGWGDAEGKVEVVFGWANEDNENFPGTVPSDTAWDVQVDRSVGTDRVVVFGFGSAPDGSGRTDADRYVARLNITNTGADADPTFNSGNAFTLNAAASLGDNARRGIVEDNGKIVSAGYANLGTGLGNHIVMFRLNANGTLDSGFGGFSSRPSIVTKRAGVAVFNPFVIDEGFSESYAVGYQKGTASYVTTGYGAATAADTFSSFGYETTIQQDIAVFRVSSGTAASVDMGFGNNGHMVVQSEGLGLPTNEDRGRHLVVLPDDRILIAGRFGGNAAAVVLTADGQPDESVFGDGIIELPHDDINSQFFGLALSEDGKRVAMSTDNNANGARLVVLEIAD